MNNAWDGCESRDLTFHIETLGCPKNRVDSRKMAISLLQAGFRQAAKAEHANLLLINSCSFIQEAQEETIKTVFEFLKFRENKKSTQKVGLVGCFVERFSNETKSEIPELDFTAGVRNFHDMPALLAEKFNIQITPHAANLSVAHHQENPYAFFRTATGCSRSCSFCIIPAIRGKLNTFSLEMLKEQLFEDQKSRQTVPLREAVLVSQDTISQGLENLEEIIDFLQQVESIKIIRLQYLFPDKRILKLLDLFKKYSKLAPYLDIPFQHTSAAVLKRMNRPTETGLFSEILQKARDIDKNLEVRTSFIVGFPGETDHEHNELYRFLEDHRIDKLALFRYSHELGTSAATNYQDDVQEDIKIERMNKLRDFHLEQRTGYRKSLIGRTEPAIIDKKDKKETIGRRIYDSPEIDEVVFLPPAPGDVSVGDIVNIKLETPMEYDWIGDFIFDDQ